jgi:hypothetical protein
MAMSVIAIRTKDKRDFIDSPVDKRPRTGARARRTVAWRPDDSTFSWQFTNQPGCKPSASQQLDESASSLASALESWLTYQSVH